MPTKTPRTVWFVRSLMKLRRTRDEYWLAANDSETMVMEKTTPATVIIEPAIVDSMPREPAAPAPNRRGQLAMTFCASIRSVSISANASVTAAQTITAGTNQKLDRRSVKRSRGFFMIVRVPPSLHPVESRS